MLSEFPVELAAATDGLVEVPEPSPGGILPAFVLPRPEGRPGRPGDPDVPAAGSPELLPRRAEWTAVLLGRVLAAPAAAGLFYPER